MDGVSNVNALHNGVRLAMVSNWETKFSGRRGISQETISSQSAVAICKSLAAVHKAAKGP